MPYIIKVVLGESESVQTAQKEIERLATDMEAKGVRVWPRTPTSLEVGEGGRAETEAIIDSPDNWEHGTFYMEADDPAQGNL